MNLTTYISKTWRSYRSLAQCYAPQASLNSMRPVIADVNTDGTIFVGKLHAAGGGS